MEKDLETPVNLQKHKNIGKQNEGSDEQAQKELGPELANQQWKQFYRAVSQATAALRYEEK